MAPIPKHGRGESRVDALGPDEQIDFRCIGVGTLGSVLAYRFDRSLGRYFVTEPAFFDRFGGSIEHRWHVVLNQYNTPQWLDGLHLLDVAFPGRPSSIAEEKPCKNREPNQRMGIGQDPENRRGLAPSSIEKHIDQPSHAEHHHEAHAEGAEVTSDLQNEGPRGLRMG